VSLPILLVDFDGCIHSYTSGWQGAEVVSDEPVEGAFTFLARAMKHFDVQVYSSRTSQEGGLWAMTRWFKRHGWPPGKDGVLEGLTFPRDKPAAFLSIDDRCFLFEGAWPDPEQLTKFETWNKKAL
jgi:hypothetical protein